MQLVSVSSGSAHRQCHRRAKAAGLARVGSGIHMLAAVLRWVCISLVFAAILAACGARPPTDGPLFGTGVFHPPPKPGTSISQTRMCECNACEPSDCCDGPADDEPPPECSYAYEFAENDQACGISIRSCSSRCAREVWRVKSNEECADKRPASCCRAG